MLRSGGFDPGSYGDLDYNLDAAVPTSLFQNSARTLLALNTGDPVGGIADQGSKGINGSQTTDNRRPLLQNASQNGKAGLLFDGSNDAISIVTPVGVAVGLSFYIVLQPATQNNCYCADALTTNLPALISRFDNGGRKDFEYFTPSQRLVIAASAPGAHLISFRGDNSRLIIFLDNTQIHDVTPVTGLIGRNMVVLGGSTGGSDPYNAIIYQALSYDEFHSDARAAAIRAALISKWKIS